MTKYVLLACTVLSAGWLFFVPAAVQAQSAADLHIMPVQGNVYMLVTPDGNIAMSVGPDGILLVDSGAEEYADYIAAASLQLATDLTASPRTSNCRGLKCPGDPFGWSSPSLAARIASPGRAKPVRYIINTSVDEHHVGGNARLGELPENSGILGVTFPPVGLAPSANIISHENVLIRMSEPVGDGEDTVVDFTKWPSLTYREPKYKLSEFFNGEGVELRHAPHAHTDGDTMVYFRYSDVIAAGDVLDTTRYPYFDLEKGGSIDGIIEGLDQILDVAVAEFRSQGGTLIIPGHGRLMDVGDTTNYRNMVEIIRDRVRDGIARGMTLPQIQAARFSMDYDPIFGSDPEWTPQMFVEAVYESLQNPPEPE